MIAKTLQAAKSDWPLEPNSPFTPGHEAIVVAPGARITAATVLERHFS